MSEPAVTIYTLTHDDWMNLAGVLGALILLGAWLAIWKSWSDYNALWNVICRYIGLALLLVPLFFRWFLSQDLLVTIGLLMAAVGLYVTIRRQVK